MCFSCLHAIEIALLKHCFGKPFMHLQMHFFGLVKIFERHALLLPTVGFRFLDGRHFFLSVVALSCVADLCADVALLQNDRWNRRKRPSLRFALLVSPKQNENPADDHSTDDDG